MTPTINAAKSQLHLLAGGKKLPAGMDKATLAKAHADLASLDRGSAAATEQYKAGDWSGAVAMAEDLDALGLQPLKTIDVK